MAADDAPTFAADAAGAGGDAGWDADAALAAGCDVAEAAAAPGCDADEAVTAAACDADEAAADAGCVADEAAVAGCDVDTDAAAGVDAGGAAFVTDFAGDGAGELAGVADLGEEQADRNTRPNTRSEVTT